MAKLQGETSQDATLHDLNVPVIYHDHNHDHDNDHHRRHR
jgi:hypothetical protein